MLIESIKSHRGHHSEVWLSNNCNTRKKSTPPMLQ